MTAFIASFIMIFAAEMGDKTQLLALALASKYKVGPVLLGSLIATILLNTLAVGAGSLLTTFVPMKVISFAAALSFIFFGLWSLKNEEEDGEKAADNARFGPVAAVAAAFFLAELGDKTQLAAISLAVGYKSFFPVLAGTTAGMFLADTLGILAGGELKKRVPERYIKYGAAVIFILFGIWSLWDLLR